MLHSETLLKKGRREEKGEDGTSRNKNPKSPLHTQAREQVFGKKDTGPQPRTEQLAVRGRGVGVGGRGRGWPHISFSCCSSQASLCRLSSCCCASWSSREVRSNSRASSWLVSLSLVFSALVSCLSLWRALHWPSSYKEGTERKI